MFDSMTSSRPHDEDFQTLDVQNKRLVQAQKRIDVVYLCCEHQQSMRQVARTLDFHFTSIRNIMKKYRESGDAIGYLKNDLDLTKLRQEFDRFSVNS